MNILLIDPPFYRLFGFYNRYFPLGITQVGTFLHASGHAINVYDADCNDKAADIDYTLLPQKYQQYLDTFKDENNPVWSEVRRRIEAIRPDMVGISVWTTYAASAFYTARISKAINPDCAVVMGGPHASVKADEILRISRDVDYVIRGEGEFAAAELAESIEHGFSGLASIQGLSYRTGSEIRHNVSRPKMTDLDRFPIPDRSLLINETRYSSEDMGLIMTSRGCPFHCTYCATDTRRVSYRSIDNVLTEIRLVKDRYGTAQFSFKDDSFTVDKKRVEELCDRMIAERYNVNWECNTRVNLITEGTLKKMKEAGCNGIKIGIESGSERVLEMMQKGITKEQIRRTASLLRDVGIHWTGYFMMGIPGETLEDVYQTLNFMHELNPDFASIGVYEPFPGTRMFEDGKRRELVKEQMTLEEYFETPPNHYYKIDPQKQVDTIEGESFAALEAEMKGAFHAHNKSIRKILRRAKSRTNMYVKEPGTLVNDIRRYLSWR